MTRDEIDALDGELTFKLHKPVEWEGRSWSEITVREPTGGQMVEISKKQGWESTIFSVALCSGTPESVVRLMVARDVDKAGEFIAAFLGVGPTGTGKS